MKPEFKLYHFESCPYCQMVRRAAFALNVRLTLIDIRKDRKAAQRLQAARGRQTVPVLETPEGLMGESADIVAYLKRWAKHAA